MDREDTERPYAALPLPRHGNGLRTGRGQPVPAREFHLIQLQDVSFDTAIVNVPDYLAAESFCGEFIADFYDSAKAERGYPLRLDVLVAYDLEQLEPVPDDRSMAYVFRDPADRLSAVAAIINVPGAQQER